MNLKMVGAGGEILAEREASPKPKKEKVSDEELFDINKVDRDFRELMCDKLIAACDLIGEHPRTGETKVFNTPIEAQAWERQMERDGLNLVHQ